MVFPLAIEHAEQDHALVIAHRLRADNLFLRFVTRFELFKNCLAQLVAIELGNVNAFLRDVHAKVAEDFFLQSCGVPSLSMVVTYSSRMSSFSSEPSSSWRRSP